MFNAPWSRESGNAAAGWFEAVEALGDDIGIRYGRVCLESNEVEWFRVSHRDCDGIGGFARLLRERGHEILRLPQAQRSCRGIVRPIWNLWRHRVRPADCADRHDWAHAGARLAGVPNRLAWHVFSEGETTRIRDGCRRREVTVNSLLLRHLDSSVRPELGIHSARIPWMIPVNLRGDVRLADDTANHVSSVDVLVSPDESAFSIHQRVLHQLALAEHRANFLLLEVGGILSKGLKMRHLRRDRAKRRGNIGAFSNLGVWNGEKRIDPEAAWLFCPPVVQGQRLAAGCVTYGNKLGLMMQTRPHASEPPDLMTRWMDRWVGGMLSDAG